MDVLQKYDQCQCNILYPHHIEHDDLEDSAPSPVVDPTLPTMSRLIVTTERKVGSDIIDWTDLPSGYDLFVGVETDESIKNVFYRFDCGGQTIEIEAFPFHGTWRILRTPIPFSPTISNLQVKIVAKSWYLRDLVVWCMNVPDSERQAVQNVQLSKMLNL